MAERTNNRGASAFDAFYSRMHGERWEALRGCLSRPGNPVAYTDGLIAPYYLDEASIAAARALEVQPGDSVLDMCAAPGGKSLVLAVAATAAGTLVANERSAARRARLIRVLDDHLPPQLRARVTVTSHDATRWGLYEKNRYDRVLLDAPCSSESHVIRSPEHLAQWSAARTQHLATQAHAMLAAAVEAAKPGGLILYSTCSVSGIENDEVLRRLLKKRGQLVTIVPTANGSGERTEFGTEIFPDRCNGQGPIYFALLRKSGRD